jgi:trimethylamine--corrinoid protein Co-methyltransferase
MREMAAAIAGGAEKLRQRPMLSYVICPVAPLGLIRDVCDIIIDGARNMVPVTPVSIVMAGGSSPMSLAGAVVTTNAELLSCLTLSQLTRKGAPVVYGSSSSSMDLRYASASVGSPECGLINAAIACMARAYLLPSWVAGQ